MKRFFKAYRRIQAKLTIGLLLGVLLLVTTVFAGYTVWIGTLVTITTSPYYSSTNNIGTVVVPPGSLMLSVSNLTTTNSITNIVQVSLDGTNFVPVATNQPAITNGTYQWYVAAGAIPIYARLVVTTNTSQTGAIQMGGGLSQ